MNPFNLLQTAQERLPYLRALSHILWEPYRNAWVETALNYFISELSQSISSKQLTKTQINEVKELLEKYQQCLNLFVANKNIGILQNTTTNN